MRRRFPFTSMFFLAATLFLLPDSEVQAAGNLTQNSSRECAICHFRWIDQFVEGHGTALADYEKEDVAGHEMICFSCHDGSTDDSRMKVWILDRHKTDIQPSDKVQIPKLFPLSQDGKVVCATCHSAHSVPTDTSIERTIFLRISNKDSIMCEMCHPDQAVKDHNHPTHSGKRALPKEIYTAGAVPSSTDTNFVICESCHTAHGSVERNLLFEVKADSTLCTICHPDKIDAANAPLDKQVNHPLLVDFKPNPNVGVKLQVGTKNTLQCLSCHKLHQHEKGTKSLVQNRESLCQLCHADKADRSSIADWQKSNHPLYVKYKLNPASTVKLDGGAENTVYCFTCHKVHQHEPGTKALAAKRDPLCSTCHNAQYLVDDTDHDLSITAKDEINAIEQTIAQAGVCSACHVPHKATGPYLWARKVKDPSALSSPSKLCLSCHADNAIAAKKTVGRFTHPVNIPMKEAEQLKDPATLPLYKKEDGSAVMECHTCHDPHRWDSQTAQKGKGINDEGTAFTSFLRKRSGTDRALCASCHADQYLVEGTDHDLAVTAPKENNITKQNAGQSGVCSPCHVPHQASGPYLWARKFDKKPTSPSSLCLDCHDKKKPAEKKTVGQNSHPVNIQVENALSVSLPLRKLSDGTSVMECHSCHDPHRWNSQLSKKGQGANVEGDADSSFLRSSNLEEPSLCAKCHLRKSFVAGTDHDMRVVAPTSLNKSGKMAKEESVCTPCHAVHNAPEKTLLWNYTLAETGQDFIEKACNGCHAKTGAGKDKVIASGIHPKQFYFGYHKSYRNILLSIGPTPDPIPLYAQDGKKAVSGEITCSTCHDPHIWFATEETVGAGKNIEGTVVNSFLRKGARNELCYACHGIKTLLLYRFYHDANEKKGILGISMPTADEIEQSNAPRQPAGEFNENNGEK
ncbi:MAG: cytochrome c3 family protein [Thermodesulfobacteriota bacterium]